MDIVAREEEGVYQEFVKAGKMDKLLDLIRESALISTAAPAAAPGFAWATVSLKPI